MLMEIMNHPTVGGPINMFRQIIGDLHANGKGKLKGTGQLMAKQSREKNGVKYIISGWKRSCTESIIRECL